MTDGTLKIAETGQCRWGRQRGTVRSGLLLVLLALPAFAAGPGKAKPAEKDIGPVQAPPGTLRIPLSGMGYQILQQDFMVAGSSMLTVHFVDRDHLLVTFAVRRLMKREAEGGANDQDRVIGANLVELPSGKVLAHTEWRLHDRSQYLYPLGHGRFAVRVRDRLTLIAPMAAANAADAFREYPLLRMDDHILVALTSPDDDLLTVETTQYAMSAGETREGFSLDRAPVEISFFRIRGDGLGADPITVSSAGKIRTRNAVALPMNSAGRLVEVADGKNGWLFSFEEHAGKVDELAGFATTCPPRPVLVGDGEFVAFGCHGSENSVDLAGFNMKGEEMWQQNLFESYVAPTFAFAPAGGRFALGRTLVSGDFGQDMDVPATAVTGQEVRVYQTYNGKQLLKIDLSPVERAGENFALSEDGLRLAVVRETMVRHAATKDFAAYTQNEAAVEIYTLPPLSAEDVAAVKEASTRAPLDTGARIDLALARSAGPKQKAESPEPPSPVAEASSVAADVGAAVPTAIGAEESAAPPEGTVEEGDVQPTGPRKKPTLYGPDDPPQKTPQ